MTRAAIYCRISLDADGESLGVARQESDCRELAQREGWEVAATFTDNDVGASTRSRKKQRPGYAEMMRRAEAGEFAALIAYSNSRLTRRPLELEDLIAVHERTGARIVTVVSGEDNLATADGRMVARIKASVDAAEAERTAERVARKHLESAQAGKPVGGTRPFGWEKDGATIRDREAVLIRQAAVDLLDGVGVRTICRQWNENGITTSPGREWTPATLRQMLKSPRLSGWRIHRGKIAVGRDGEPVRGLWAPILDQRTHDAVVARLSKPDGRARIPRRDARHYLLTGTARCGVCGGPMYGNKVGERFDYRCSGSGHVVGVSGGQLDALVTDVLLARLVEIEIDPAHMPQFDGLARLGEVEGQIGELMSAFTAGRLTGAVVFPAVEELESERDRLRAERRTVEAAAALPELQRMDRAGWDALDTERQRAVVESLLSAVLIRPATHRGNTFDFERVEFVWKGSK